MKDVLNHKIDQRKGQQDIQGPQNESSESLLDPLCTNKTYSTHTINFPISF